MRLSDFINNDVKPLDSNSKISDLQQLFKQLTYSHIPIQDADEVFLGSFSETDAYCFDSDKMLSDYQYAIEDFFVRDTTIWLDVLEAFAKNDANIMPVLNNQNVYLGYYELKEVINFFSESPFFSEPGNILVIEKGTNDYSFSEISQIVESNNGRVLGAFISKMTPEAVQITLKVANTSLNDILQTFRRYSYTIISGHVDDSYMEGLKERSDYLNKYLSI